MVVSLAGRDDHRACVTDGGGSPGSGLLDVKGGLAPDLPIRPEQEPLRTADGPVIPIDLRLEAGALCLSSHP